MLKAIYQPEKIETKIYRQWEKSGFFNPDKLPTKRRKKFIVYMPLPNITGSLHLGHALDNGIADILIRYHRMRGKKTLWLPGTDHAGIATQYVVEKELRKEGLSRFDLGREKFINRVWQWRKKYGNIILKQLKKLGCSADWSRTRFTLNPSYSRDVLKAFIHYYQKGLIYEGLKVVNWCPSCHTSLSELELEYKEEKTKLYYLRYGKVIVATTRPETMLGDAAVAVHPSDKRYSSLIGQKVFLPIQNREIPIIADKAVDKNFGTGAVKITPAHDLLDFEISQRHHLPLIKVIDENGLMNENAGRYAGLKTSKAKELILQELKNQNVLVKEEPYTHRVAICSRCSSIIEPLPSKQWFLKMDELKNKAQKAVKNGWVKIIPKNFEKIYFDWLNNVKDWCISRQIWWGHQLPVWFCQNQKDVSEQIKNFKKFKNGKLKIENSSAESEKFVVALKRPQKCPFCKNGEMKQSTDVLDTWFSSALWPFAGLSQKDLKKYFPGNLVSNARDILNLWDSRMIFSSLEFFKKVPFKTVLIHGTILTKEGKRMSKSLGTGIDPLAYIKNYGADALRFAVIWQAKGQDIHWDERAVVAGKKFTNKIWNAARFILNFSNSSSLVLNQKSLKIKPLTLADKKILLALKTTKKNVEKNLEKFKFSQALYEIYHFFWHQFCDQYIEQSKKQILDSRLQLNTQNILFKVLLESLKMLHPFLPFISEAIYQNLPSPFKKEKFLLIEKW